MKTSRFPSLLYMAALFLSLPFPWPANSEMQTPVPFQSILHIPLRVHLGSSDRAPQEWLPILEEINYIWRSQAGICFEIHTVIHEDELENGLDLWFESTITNWNGYFTDLHDIHVRDNPNLRPAKHPAGSSAARTAAHELGHALKLPHRQDSDDNLMRSKTYGWQLDANEIMLARSAAAELSAAGTSARQCALPTINPDP